MKQRTYSIVLEPEERGDDAVTVPALPGCFTQGKTVEEAMERAAEPSASTLRDLKPMASPCRKSTSLPAWSLSPSPPDFRPSVPNQSFAAVDVSPYSGMICTRQVQQPQGYRDDWRSICERQTARPLYVRRSLPRSGDNSLR